MVDLGVPRSGVIAARVSLISIAAAAFIWTIIVFPKFWSETSVVEAASHIINGEVYKPQGMEVLEADIGRNQNSLRPSILSKVAIIRLRLAEEAISSGNQQLINRRTKAADEAVNEALWNTPSESFQWLVLFWLKKTNDGFEPAILRYLQMSYALDPRAAWIAVKRGPVALSVYPQLPTNLADGVIAEFLGLVRSQLYNEASEIVAGTARPVRNVLLASLDDLKPPDRLPLDRILYEKNLSDMLPAGVKERPWQR